MGPFHCLTALLLVAVVMVHNHDTIVVRMPVMAVLHDNGLGAGNRRRRDRDRSQCGNDASKLLHFVLLLISMNGQRRTGPAVPAKQEENSEHPFRL
jgi:hypothetical protein